MIRIVSRTPVIISDLEDMEGSWLETWMKWVILDIIMVLDIQFMTFVQNFSILAGLEGCQETTFPDVGT